MFVACGRASRLSLKAGIMTVGACCCKATDGKEAEDETSESIQAQGSALAAVRALGRPKAVAQDWIPPSAAELEKLLKLLEDCAFVELSEAATSQRHARRVPGQLRVRKDNQEQEWSSERFILELAPGQKPTKDTRIRDGREVAIFAKRSITNCKQEPEKDQDKAKQGADEDKADEDVQEGGEESAEEEQEEADEGSAAEETADEEHFWDDEGFSEDASVPPVRLWRVPLREIIEHGKIVGKRTSSREQAEDYSDHDDDSASELADDTESDREANGDREPEGLDDPDAKKAILKKPELANSVTGLRFVLKRISEKKLERFDERLFDEFLVQDYDTCAAESLTAACNAVAGTPDRPKAKASARRISAEGSADRYTREAVFDAYGKAAIRKLGGKSKNDPAMAIKTSDDKNTKRLKRLVRNYKKGGCWEATWDVGNADIEDACSFFLGFKASRLLGRNWMSEPPPKGSREEDVKKAEMWSLLKDHFSGGAKCNDGVLLFHLQGYDTGHYTLIFGLREVSLTEEDPNAGDLHSDKKQTKNKKKKGTVEIRRDVLTSTYGQKPKHWVSLNRVYNMLFQSKFTGYAIIKIEPK
eukprot:TRINITY_DN1574_c0_g2_i1.p1 TRINITY_DN1574_c0_g2~~TRINITY_DN1574_c0_g2_i1.p1  ORF type:complete len:588 (+),score=103.80 TRINITY_DN1574_c0_g2_i1:1446-3209(+)